MTAPKPCEYTLWAEVLGKWCRVTDVIFYKEVVIQTEDNFDQLTVVGKIRLVKVRLTSGQVHLITLDSLRVQCGFGR